MTGLRRHQVSRIEGFSDAVFGFALTLLVVSLEVPADFAALERTLGGFLPFAATFAVVSWIWYEHYAFFRRFGLEDVFTVVANSALLFVVLFFVYPLKFVFARVFAGMTGDPSGGFGTLTVPEARLLLIIYSLGFVVVFAIFALFYWHAHRRRHALLLSPLEAFDARAGARTHMVSVTVGAASVLLALVVPAAVLWIPGMLYWLLAPLHAANGYVLGRARTRLAGGDTLTGSVGG